MKTSSVAELLQSDITLQEVTLKGWVRTFRSNRFIALNVLTHPFNVTSCKVISDCNNSATLLVFIIHTNFMLS